MLSFDNFSYHFLVSPKQNIQSKLFPLLTENMILDEKYQLITYPKNLFYQSLKFLQMTVSFQRLRNNHGRNNRTFTQFLYTFAHSFAHTSLKSFSRKAGLIGF